MLVFLSTFPSLNTNNHKTVTLRALTASAPPNHPVETSLMFSFYYCVAPANRLKTNAPPRVRYRVRARRHRRHKPTVLYDPAKSETYRALQEEGLGDTLQEVPTPVQPKVFQAPTNKRPTPTPKPKQPEAKPKGKQTTFVNSLNEEHIQQSNSFKRLMYSVLGDTEF